MMALYMLIIAVVAFAFGAFTVLGIVTSDAVIYNRVMAVDYLVKLYNIACGRPVEMAIGAMAVLLLLLIFYACFP